MMPFGSLFNYATISETVIRIMKQCNIVLTVLHAWDAPIPLLKFFHPPLYKHGTRVEISQ